MVRIDILDFLPKEIISKKGPNKPLEIQENENKLILFYKGGHKDLIINRYINLTEEDFITVGLYLAEGSKYINYDKMIKHNGDLSFTNSQLISLDLFLKLIKKFGIKREVIRWSIDLNINLKDKFSKEELSDYWINYLKLNINRRRKRWFRHRGRIGGFLSNNTGKFGTVELRYASTLFRSIFLYFIDRIIKKYQEENNRKILSYILKGYFAGDGNAYLGVKQKRYWKRSVEFLCSDEILRTKLRKALETIGLTSIKETDPINTKTHSHSLRIYNYHDFNVLRKYDIPNLIDYKRETFQDLMNSFYSKHL